MIDFLAHRSRTGLFNGGRRGGKLFTALLVGPATTERFNIDSILIWYGPLCCYMVGLWVFCAIFESLLVAKIAKPEDLDSAELEDREHKTFEYLFTYTIVGFWIIQALGVVHWNNHGIKKKKQVSNYEVSTPLEKYCDGDCKDQDKELHEDVSPQNKTENEKKEYFKPQQTNKMDAITDLKRESDGINIDLGIVPLPLVRLSKTVRVEGLKKHEGMKKISMVIKGNQCIRRSKLLDSEFVSIKNLKTGKTDLQWMTRMMRFLRTDIEVHFNEPQYIPSTNTVNLILARYFSSNPPTKRETMAYELLRLCTLHDFPKSTGQSCIRLAQAAFFYEGKDDEVTCFSCSIQICGWQPRDIPLDRHRETSPNCLFIKCQDSGNVPICQTGSNRELECEILLEKSDPESESGSECSERAVQSNFASEVPTKENKVKSSSDKAFVTTAHGAASSVAQTSEASCSSGYGSKSSSSSQPSGSISTSSSQSYVTTSGALSRTGISDTQTPNQYTITSTNRNRAHYPEYVLVNDRLRSFDRGWPDYVSQSPQMMVESGFFFAGYEDCVRCFQCGIGLRNWEPPDNPHVEHARWSPKCPFLLGVKGQDFINLVLDAVAQLAIRSEQSANTLPTLTESNPGKAVLLQQASQQRNTTLNSPVTAGNSSRTDTTGSDGAISSQPSRSTGAAQSDQIRKEATQNILKKGFSESEIKKAIEKIVETDGLKNVTEDRVLKTIQEQKQRERLHPPGLRGGDASQKNPSLSTEIDELKKKNREMREMTICKICLEEEVSIVFLPCGHLVACAQCAPALSRCAVCRKPITGTICAHLDV